MVTNTTKLQEKIMALTNIDGSGGVDILTRSGDFKSTYDILLEISKVWKDMGDVEQAALLELVAGKTRGSVVAALFQNGDVLENAYKSATDASGSAMRELNNHLDSIQGRIDLFNNSVQTMWMNFINDDVIKFFVDVGTWLIKLVDFIHPLNVAVAGLFGGLFAKFKMKQNNTDILGLLFDVAPTKIKNIPAIKNIASTIKTAYYDELKNVVGSASAIDIFAEFGNHDYGTDLIGDAMAQWGVNDANMASIPIMKQQVKVLLQKKVAEGAVNKETAEAILNNIAFATSEGTATVATNVFTASLARLWAGLVGVAKSLWGFITTHPYITALAVAAVALGVAFNTLSKAHENHIEKLNEETEALKSVQSELESVRSELESVASRMDELNAKGTLSFVEQEEYNRLQQITAELERQEAILLAQEQRAKKKQIKTALNAAKTDKNLKDDASEQQNTYLTGGQSAATSNMPNAAALQYSNTPTITSSGNAWEVNLNKLQEAKNDLNIATENLSKTTYDAESKEYKKLEKQVESAQARVDMYNAAIDSMNETWETEYGEVGYIENATTEPEKQWNELYSQHQDYLDQQALINGVYGKSTILDRIFGMTGTDVAKAFKKEFESGVKNGGDPTEVIESLFSNANYSSAFTGLEEQFGITMDNIKAYFTQTGEFTIDPNFDITKYTHDIKSHSAVISEFQDAIQSLGKGTFTMDDYLDLIERFPDLAKGVDISSNAFYGLSRNLNKAIKTRTKDFIDDLKELKKSLVAAGKSTDAVDQLIVAIENMPDDALDNSIEKYSTLADEIERAKVANDRLMNSMGENPNEGYENRGEALEYMKDALSKGEIGSESNVWNVAEEYGFTYDSAKTINENADALANFIAIRDRWWKTEDDGDNRTNDGYSHEGTVNFLEDVESAIKSPEFKKAMEQAGLNLNDFIWSYDEETGAFEYDFDNKNWDFIVSALGQTEELAGLTSNEFADLIMQIGQFFELKWEDADDVSHYITKLAGSSGTAADKIEQMTDSVETYVEKALGIDLDFSSLTEASIDALDCDESIKNLLKTYLKLKEELEDPLGIETKLDEGGTIDSLLEIKELQGVIKKDSSGLTVVDIDGFSAVLKEAGYTEKQIEDLIKKIQEYQGVVALAPDDPLGLNGENNTISTVMSSLDLLGVKYELTKGTLENPIAINITSTDLISALKAKGWEPEQISTYLQTLSANAESLGLTIDGKTTMNQEEIDEAIAKIENAPTTINGKVLFDYTEVKDYAALVASLNNKTITTYVDEVHREYNPDTGEWEEVGGNGHAGANGTAHAQGTANATGSWGAPKTETALVGELGPELLVRNGRWTTIGNNGAEFAQIRRGDIIFNHQQTKDLLSKGYVTGRGKLQGGLSAFASGTALISGNSIFGRYEFDGNGGWKEYDVNDKIVDSANGVANALSDAANALSNSTDEFREVFDWIEVRIEELDETLGLLESQIENAAYYNEKNTIIDDLINTNKVKLENLEAGYQKYADYAAELLTKVPEQYRDAVQNGAIDIEAFVGETDEKTLEAINNYREWSQKSADYKQQANEILTTIRDLAIQKFDNAYEAGEVRATVEDSQTEKLQNAVDYDEERGLITSDAYYIAMMENSNKKIEYLTAAREAMQEELDEAVKSGQIEKGSNEWYELVNQMYEVDAAIDEATIEVEEFQNAINDIYWDNFDQLINRIDYLKNDTQNLIDLMDHEDMVSTPDEKRKYEGGTVEYWTADDVQWTDEGLASLGLYAQQMEIAEYEARQYATAIDDLTKEYEAGNYSENEYLEKLNDLKDKQYESIESYYDAQDAIKDLNKTRIDSIKEGIEKEIEAYEELINAKKELLDSEKDMHDFQKSVMEQQKNISDIERKLAALAYDTSASAAAKRARLEADLAEAKAELEETYYDRSIEDQQNALDEELENFQKEKDEEITKLEEYVENVEQVVTDSLNVVQANAAEIGKTLTDKTTEYNLTVSSAVLDPWKNGATAVSDYQTAFDTATSSTTTKLTEIKNLWQDIIDKMAEAGKTNVGDINIENERYALGKTNWGEVMKKHLAQVEKENMGLGKYYVVKPGDNLWDIAEQELGDGARWIDIFDINRSIITDPNLIQPGWKLRIPAFAKGTTSVPKDQWSIIDELGEELQLIPDGSGRLAYMKKGTGVVPADLTSNLMEWGKLDPSVMLEQNRPQIGVSPSVVNNTTEIHIDASVGELLHVEHIDGNNPAEISKIVDKAWDKRMKELNSHIRRYTNR